MPGAAFKIKSLKIEGFKAFAAPQLLEIGGHVFVFGRNGLGKSSVVEAVRWCLFGLAERPEAEVRNVFYPAGECKVELELEGPGGLWSIQRRLRPGSGRSYRTIQDPSGTTVPQATVFPNLARLGPREGTHIIFASQQSIQRRPQADITDFDKVLYSYLRIDDVPNLLVQLEKEIEEKQEIERQLAEEVDDAEESLRSKVNEPHSRIEEILASAPWPGGAVPTSAETDARIRSFVVECGGNLEHPDGGNVTREWLLEEAARAIQQLSTATKDVVEGQLDEKMAAFQEIEAANETFKEQTKQLKTAQIWVGSCAQDLKNALGDKTKQQLIEERKELIRQDNQLAQYLELGQQAADYLEEFLPEECPVCDTGVAPADVLSRLQGRIGADPRTAELADALERVQAHLKKIGIAEAALEKAEAARAADESGVEEARIQLEKLLEGPADLSSSDRTLENLADHIQQLKRECTKAGSLVAIKQDTLKNLRAEARFQRYRSREERLLRILESGLEPAREALREFADVLMALRTIRNALQESFNNTLDEKKPQINALMTEVYGRLTQQASFPKIEVQSGPADKTRELRVGVTSDRTPGKSFLPYEVLNGQAFNALNLVPYFVFSKFQSEALELDCLLIDDPSQSFDTSRVELLLQELKTAATHAQLIVASHEEDRFRPFIDKYFPADSYRVLRVTAFDPDLGPTLEYAD